VLFKPIITGVDDWLFSWLKTGIVIPHQNSKHKIQNTVFLPISIVQNLVTSCRKPLKSRSPRRVK
jgi:hypothetical protein